jgi:hypothetical protein
MIVTWPVGDEGGVNTGFHGPMLSEGAPEKFPKLWALVEVAEGEEAEGGALLGGGLGRLSSSSGSTVNSIFHPRVRTA